MRLHPITIPYRALSRASTGASILGLLGLGLRSLDVIGLPVVIAMAIAGAAIGGLYGVVSYWRFDYRVEGDALEVRRGVIARRTREIPFQRIQNVDVTRSVLQRAFGVAVVRVETAGGSATEAVLAFVARAEADRLTRRLAARSGADEGIVEEPSAAAVPTAERSGRDLFTLRDHELLILSLVAFYPGAAVVLFFIVPLFGSQLIGFLQDAFTAVGLPGTLAGALREPVYALGITSVSGAALLFFTWLISGAAAVNRYYGFRLREAEGSLQYERGLLRRFNGSIPLSKLQRLSVREPFLARRLGYAALRIETAGYAGSGQNSSANASQTAVPIATRHRVWELVALLDGPKESTIELERPPRIARRRYVVRYLLVLVAVTLVLYAVSRYGPISFAYWLPLLGVPIAGVAGHFKWRHRGYYLGPEHIVVRTGFWSRRTHIVPHYRVQAIIRSATPFQRRLGLANLTIDTATAGRVRDGAATAFDVEASTAIALSDAARTRLSAQLRDQRFRTGVSFHGGTGES